MVMPQQGGISNAQGAHQRTWRRPFQDFALVLPGDHSRRKLLFGVYVDHTGIVSCVNCGCILPVLLDLLRGLQSSTYTRKLHLQKPTTPGPRILSHLDLPSQSPPPSRLLAVAGASASRRGHQAAVFVEVDMMLTPSLHFRSLGGRERRHSSPRSASAPGMRCWLAGTSYQRGNRSRALSTRRFAEPGCV